MQELFYVFKRTYWSPSRNDAESDLVSWMVNIASSFFRRMRSIVASFVSRLVTLNYPFDLFIWVFSSENVKTLLNCLLIPSVNSPGLPLVWQFYQMKALKYSVLIVVRLSSYWRLKYLILCRLQPSMFVVFHGRFSLYFPSRRISLPGGSSWFH